MITTSDCVCSLPIIMCPRGKTRWTGASYWSEKVHKTSLPSFILNKLHFMMFSCRWRCAVAFQPPTWRTWSSGGTTHPPSTPTSTTARLTWGGKPWLRSMPWRTTAGWKETSSLWVHSRSRTISRLACNYRELGSWRCNWFTKKRKRSGNFARRKRPQLCGGEMGGARRFFSSGVTLLKGKFNCTTASVLLFSSRNSYLKISEVRRTPV